MKDRREVGTTWDFEVWSIAEMGLQERDGMLRYQHADGSRYEGQWKEDKQLLGGDCGVGPWRFHQVALCSSSIFWGGLDLLRILQVKWRSNIIYTVYIYIYFFFIQYYTDITIYHDHFVGWSILAALCRVCICECFPPTEARTGYRAVARW